MEYIKILFINLKAFLRNLLPIRLLLTLERLRSIPSYFSWKFDKQQGQDDFLIKTKNLHNSFSGKRCVIIGNGPSLNKIDLSLLKNEYTFGLNRIYLLFDKIGFSTTFIVSINRFVLEQFGSEIKKNNSKIFLNYKYKISEIDNNTSYVPPTIFSEKYLDRPDKGFLSYAGSVTFFAIQLALYFGFDEIILVGFDNNFKNKGKSDKAITSKGDDIDHFDKNYFGKNVVWQLPNYDSMNYNFNKIEEYFNNSSKKIVNCTVGGNLENFERHELEDYLKNSDFDNAKK
jgi:hypothetical protein